MAHVVFRKTYYTEFVEHCFRIAIRFDDSKEMGASAQHWITVTREWFSIIPDEDQTLISYLCGKEFRTCLDGLYSFEDEHAYNRNLCRLRALERDFAIYAGLYDERKRYIG